MGLFAEALTGQTLRVLAIQIESRLSTLKMQVLWKAMPAPPLQFSCEAANTSGGGSPNDCHQKQNQEVLFSIHLKASSTNEFCIVDSEH